MTLPPAIAGKLQHKTGDDSLEVIVKKVGFANKKALEDTFKMLDLDELERAMWFRW